MNSYQKPVWQLIYEMADVLAPTPEATFNVKEAIGWFSDNYPDIPTTTLKTQLYRLQTNARARKGADRLEFDLLYAVAPRVWRRYAPGVDPTPLNRLDVDDADESDDATADIDTSDGEFAAETHLRDALARNMGLIEPGLVLVGVEADAGNGRRIDLLGRATDGSYVVVELKVSKGYDRVVGQLLRYRAWVSKTMADGSPVRGVIIARTISEDLRLACAGLPDVRLVEYAMTVQLADVTVVA